VVSLALGAVGAVAWVAGKHRWDGRVVFTISQTHGVHVGDALALIPLVLGMGLAVWCWEKGATVDDEWDLSDIEERHEHSGSRATSSPR
jgi:hypothetical protein